MAQTWKSNYSFDNRPLSSFSAGEEYVLNNEWGISDQGQRATENTVIGNEDGAFELWGATIEQTNERYVSKYNSAKITWQPADAYSAFTVYTGWVLYPTALVDYTVSVWVYVPSGNPAVTIYGNDFYAPGVTSTVFDQWQQLTVTSSVFGGAYLYMEPDSYSAGVCFIDNIEFSFTFNSTTNTPAAITPEVPEYTYILRNLIADDPIAVEAEIPFSQVSFTGELNGTGTLTAKLFMNNDGLLPSLYPYGGTLVPDELGTLNNTKLAYNIQEATTPGRNSIIVKRNGAIVWGGIIWQRDYDSQSQQLTITAREMQSYFENRVALWQYAVRKVGQDIITNTSKLPTGMTSQAKLYIQGSEIGTLNVGDQIDLKTCPWLPAPIYSIETENQTSGGIDQQRLVVRVLKSDIPNFYDPAAPSLNNTMQCTITGATPNEYNTSIGGSWEVGTLTNADYYIWTSGWINENNNKVDNTSPLPFPNAWTNGGVISYTLDKTYEIFEIDSVNQKAYIEYRYAPNAYDYTNYDPSIFKHDYFENIIDIQQDNNFVTGIPKNEITVSVTSGQRAPATKSIVRLRGITGTTFDLDGIAVQSTFLNEFTIPFRGINNYDPLMGGWVESFGLATLQAKKYQGVNQLDIVTDLLQNAQKWHYGNINYLPIIVDDPTPTLIDRTFYAYELKSVWDAIREISNSGKGFDFWTYYSETTNLTTGMFLSAPRGGYIYAQDPNPAHPDCPVFIFPGNVLNYEFSEDGSLMANQFYGIGAGFNEGKLIAESTDLNFVSNYWPLIQKTGNYSDLDNPELLGNITAGTLAAIRTAPTVIKLITNGFENPTFQDLEWKLGDDCRIRIKDAYLNIDAIYRIIGYTITPGDNGPERVTIICANPTGDVIDGYPFD